MPSPPQTGAGQDPSAPEGSTVPRQRRALAPRHEQPYGPVPPAPEHAATVQRPGTPGRPGSSTPSTPSTPSGPPPHPGRAPHPDAVAHPDPRTAAEAAAVENLLRCWAREAGLPAPGDGVLRIPLPASGATLLAPVHHWSPTGWHRFGPAALAGAPDHRAPLDAVTVAALLGRETAGAAQPAPAAGSAGGAALHSTDLVARVADSVRRTAAFLHDRRQHPADGPDRFLSAEQALLLGHPLHPAPKSREGLTEAEERPFSPELRGSFPLHWIAVAPSVHAADSAWTERGRLVPAEQLTARLAGPGLPLEDGATALPLHPWQWREVRHRPETAALLDAGLLRDLGPFGAPWHPTSSVRTVYRPGAPAMLKLSLGLRITNSRRENLRKELHRGTEVHRLLRTGLARAWHAAHPGFDIVRDPAWLAVDDQDGVPVPGLDIVIRHNPFAPADDVTCLAGLVSPGWRGTGSRLAEAITRLAARTGRPRDAVAAEWLLRYLEQVVRPVLWLDGEAGIALEAHQQNTLLLLDADGWPVGGRFRDNQGYYFRESRRADLDARLPGIGVRSDTFVPDAVTDERFTYYLAINNVFGLIGAFGAQGIAGERLLLAAFRRFLTGAASGPGRMRSTLPARLLESPVLRCKANLLTRLQGLDELVGPVDTQSVYVTIANPLHA
ncbi:iron transporter [Streptomyces sp. MUM 136J]|nr:IucA/IucC family protein [Streptomyces sp. MUM 136J]MCH0561896.1 iron transporter [Streptomyces sp. MUM 2J]MCH0568791.1 iron transporter [Streptomyces sp. MUM 136J]